MSHPRSALNKPDVRSVPVYVYALCEPDGVTIRYVGRSQAPEKRRVSHLTNSSRRVQHWVRGLAREGQQPTLRILETVPPGRDAALAERAAIQNLRAAGCRLLNTSGVPGPRLILSRESDRQKLRAMAKEVGDTHLLGRIDYYERRQERLRRAQIAALEEELARPKVTKEEVGGGHV